MKGGLGRGLSSLIQSKTADAPKPAAAAPAPVSPPAPLTREEQGLAKPGEAVEIVPKGERILHVPVGDILPNPHQPRRDFDTVELEELVASVKEFGILQPLIVTERANGMFELIAGERRLRSAKEAGLKTVPVILRGASEQEKLELALIENIQRADLSPIEEAYSYTKLIEEFGLTQDKVAERVGKSRPAITNTLRLLNLPTEMQVAISDGRISTSMAKVLCGMENVKERKAMYDRMLLGEFNVREAEDAARQQKQKTSGKVTGAVRDVNLLAVEEELRRALGTKVAVNKKGPHGKITIEFYSDEEFKGIVDRLKE
jgi:ParB family chromosome partitioning protein